MVITGLTRNQLGSNPPRVRIPPSPPEKRHPIQDVFFISTPKRDGGIRRRALRKQSGGTHYIKKVSHRILIIQVLCCFLLFLLHFCHMALEACFHIFGIKRFDDINTVVINVDNLIPLAVKIAGG